MERKRVTEAAKGVGRPKVGGKFELKDHEGRTFTDQDMRGRFTLVCGVFIQVISQRKEERWKEFGKDLGSEKGHVL